MFSNISKYLVINLLIKILTKIQQLYTKKTIKSKKFSYIYYIQKKQTIIGLIV